MDTVCRLCGVQTIVFDALSPPLCWPCVYAAKRTPPSSPAIDTSIAIATLTAALAGDLGPESGNRAQAWLARIVGEEALAAAVARNRAREAE